MYHPLDGGWKFVKTKALLKVEYRVTVDYHLCRPPPSRYTEISTKYSFLYCASQETRNPNFLRRWAFFANICMRVYREVKKTWKKLLYDLNSVPGG